MAKKPDTIDPISASFDDVVESMVGKVKLATAPLRKTIAGEADKPLRIGDVEIECYVLEDETRVLSQRGLFKGLGAARGGPRNENEPSSTGTEIPRFASQNWLQPFLNSDLEVALKNPIFFQPPTGHTGYGYPATIIVDICDAIIEAEKQGATGPRQEAIVANALSLMRGFAKLGIVALVDEATGYQEFRARKALADILEAFLTDYKQKWTKTFPEDFYRQIYRLRGWEWKPWTTKRPSAIAHWTDDFVYDRIAPGLTNELRNLNPTNKSGERLAKHHQWLNPDFGHPKLKEHIAGVVALMRASSSWNGFIKALDRAFPKFGDTMQLPLDGNPPIFNGVHS